MCLLWFWLFCPCLHQSKCWQSILGIRIASKNPVVTTAMCVKWNQVNPHCQEGDKARNYWDAKKIVFPSQWRPDTCFSICIGDKADQQGGFSPWMFQGYRQCSLVTTKARRKTKAKPTCCTFWLAAAASLPHHSHLQAQGCLSCMALLNVPSWPLLRAAFGGHRHHPPSLPCWWLCGAGGSSLLAPAACPARAQKQWSVAAQVSEHKGAPHVGLKGPKSVQAVLLSVKESGLWSVGLGCGGRAGRGVQLSLCLSKMALLLSLASAGKLSPLEKQTKCFESVQRMVTCRTSMISVCSDAFQEEQVQDAEVSWRHFCSCISTSVFWLGLTARGQVLPPKISGEASDVAKRDEQEQQGCIIWGVPSWWWQRAHLAACRKQEHFDTSTPKINTQR